MISEREARKSVSQVKQIIDLLEAEDKEKIPKNVIRFFEQNSKMDYTDIISKDIDLSEQKLNELTIVLLKYIYSYIKS